MIGINVKVIIVLIMLGMAVLSDIRTGRISNSFNLCFGLIGIVFGLIIGGAKGLLVSLIGGIIPVVLLMLLFAKRIIGAGDIKLFSALGTFAGVEIIWLLIYSFLLCGIYGAVLILSRVVTCIKDKGAVNGITEVLIRDGKYTRVAFSVFIFCGYLWYLMKGGFLLGI